jgi:Zn-dependent peptidase ImmA (M78 family)
MSFKDLASKVLSEHWDGQLPVNPAKIAESMGAVVTSDPEDFDDLMTSGSFSIKDGKPTIWYNTSAPEVRQRFTIAHELGHFVLGHGEAGKVFRDGARNFNASQYDPSETSANRFAASLLMPAEAVRYWVRAKKVTDITALAVKFDVSEVAMKYRLKNLGLTG